MNANDAAATAKHTGLTAAKILFAQTAKGQDVLTDDIRTNFCPACKEQADRIEAQAAEIERLREALRNTERVLSCAIGNMEAHKECDECQQSVGTYHEAVVYARAALGETE